MAPNILKLNHLTPLRIKGLKYLRRSLAIFLSRCAKITIKVKGQGQMFKNLAIVTGQRIRLIPNKLNQ